MSVHSFNLCTAALALIEASKNTLLTAAMPPCHREHCNLEQLMPAVITNSTQPAPAAVSLYASLHRELLQHQGFQSLLHIDLCLLNNVEQDADLRQRKLIGVILYLSHTVWGFTLSYKEFLRMCCFRNDCVWHEDESILDQAPILLGYPRLLNLLISGFCWIQAIQIESVWRTGFVLDLAPTAKVWIVIKQINLYSFLANKESEK